MAGSDFIKAYFEELKQRVDSLLILKKGYSQEALLLCCCYIEGLGTNLYWPEERSNWNFFRVVKEYGEEEVLWHLHTKQLKEALAKQKGVEHIGTKIADILDENQGKLYKDEELLTLVENAITEDERQKLKKHLWRGTLAALAYSEIRCKLVHELSAANVITFDRTTFKNKPVPKIDFDLLYRVLRQILPKAKEKSLTLGKLFGYNFSD